MYRFDSTICTYVTVHQISPRHAVPVNMHFNMHVTNWFMFLLSQFIVTAPVKLCGHLAREVDFGYSNPVLTPTRYSQEIRHLYTYKKNRSIPNRLILKRTTKAKSPFAILAYVETTLTPTLIDALISFGRICTYDHHRS